MLPVSYFCITTGIWAQIRAEFDETKGRSDARLLPSLDDTGRFFDPENLLG